MALERFDRVVETTTTTGTGTYNLDGAKAGFEAFIDRVTDGATIEYCATDGTDFEIGIGTFTDASPDTLARTTILASTNSDAAVSWSAGAKDVFITLPASRMVPGDDTELAYFNGDGILDGAVGLHWIDGTSRLGIGTSNPASPLDVRGNIITGVDGSGGQLILAAISSGASGAVLQMHGSGSNDDWTLDINNNDFRFVTGSANNNQIIMQNASSGRMDLFVEGLVGINVTDPDSMLEIGTSGTGVFGLHIKGTTSQTASLFRLTDSSDADFVNFGRGLTGSVIVFNEQGVDINTRIEGSGEDNLLFIDAGNDRIGIGTGSPGVNLDIQNSAQTELRVQSTTDDAQFVADGAAGFDSRFALRENGNTEFIIMHDGSESEFQIRDGGSTGNVVFRIKNGASADVLTVDTGNVGIGMTAPNELLQVDDAIAISNDTEGSTARLTTRTSHETHTLAAAATSDTTTITIPSGARLLGISMNVNTAVVDDGGDDTWSAAFITGSTTTIVSGAAAAQNTKVDFIVPDDEKTSAATEVRFTAQGGSFSAGVIEVVAYYEELTSLANV